MTPARYHRSPRRATPWKLAGMLAAALLLITAVPARALESAAVTSPRATASLVSDTDSVAPGQDLHVGLRLRLAPGWHTYWRNPGDAGVAPDLALTLPEGARAGPIAWPTPQRFAEGPLITYGYTGEVLLPVAITSASGPLVVDAHAEWLVCEKICVPEEGSFRLELPAGTGGASPEAALFAAAVNRTPRPSPWPSQLKPDGSLSVTGTELSPATVADARFIPAASGSLVDAAPQLLSVYPGGFTLGLTLAKSFDPDGGLSGVLLLKDRTGLETDIALQATLAAASAPVAAPLTKPGVAPVAVPAAPLAAPMPLPRMLGFAFIGGLLLNLMPCVFPVLAMKAVSITSGVGRGEVRAHALSYTAGVLVTFAALGALLVGLRVTGEAAGWGFQLQSPMFVAGMAWLLFGVGLNLSGVFEIGGSFLGAGQRLTAHQGHLGSFFTGLLAVLVATPCTAPFMGVAIAAGLAAPPAVSMLVFVAMGFGLAAPTILLALLPALAGAAPRPGRWMIVLKQALAFPMYAASAWLVWVVSRQAGPPAVLAVAAGLVLLGFAAWALGVAQTLSARHRKFGQSAAFAAALAALAVLAGIDAKANGPVADHSDAWEAFSPTRLAALRSEGRPVFVNMTAAWCITCLLNERVAIASEPVRRAFEAHHVAYLKGDWTRQDPQITRFLHEYGREGVPLYVYFQPGQQQPEVLPQILTGAMLLDRIAPERTAPGRIANDRAAPDRG
jgi:thiol:disulfide interchange protein/DsbC/DsbD-like thiol-disulfide interchange protein